MIAARTKGTYTAVYCHFDGYPEGVGATLRASYTDPLKIADLLSRGGMSTLEDTVSRCEFYTDRADPEPLDIQHSKSLTDLKLIAKNYGCNYLYVFSDKSNTWRNYKV
jgi:predicted CxxxxCH...CXXCH cytochrome family protein